MKKTKSLFAVVFVAVIVTVVFALTACNFTFEGTEEWESSAEDREGAIELFDEFFAETFKNSNQTVTVKFGGGSTIVEQIDGAKSYAEYSTGTKTYAFVDGEDYIYALSFDDAEAGSYYISKEYYDANHYLYKGYMEMFKLLPEDAEEVTYTCNVKGEGTFGENEEDNKSNATFTLEIKNGDSTLTITATTKDGLLQSASYKQVEDGQTISATFTFTYGNASVTTPDLTDWSKEELTPGDEVVDEPIDEEGLVEEVVVEEELTEEE